MRTLFAAASAAVLLTLAAPCAGADLPADAMPMPLAREVVTQAIALVDAKGVHPRSQAEYAYAKSQLLLTVANGGEQVDRNEVYGRIRKLLATLDADGHSFLMPAAQKPVQQQGQQQPASQPLSQLLRGMAGEELRAPSFRLVTTSRGTVLRWTPPAIVGAAQDTISVYVKRFYDEAAGRPDIKEACALVVDLGEQTGGNAWPPFVAMYPLFSDANKANWVDRDDKRIPFVNRANLARLAGVGAGGRANPLAPFADGPLAVVVGSRTASAGEMLLVALLGENRVQTFGQTSRGLSTANNTYPLADGSKLVLTEMRYAVGDGPVYRGGIPAMHPVEKGAPVDAATRAAAEWAAANSPACGPGPRVASSTN